MIGETLHALPWLHVKFSIENLISSFVYFFIFVPKINISVRG